MKKWNAWCEISSLEYRSIFLKRLLKHISQRILHIPRDKKREQDYHEHADLSKLAFAYKLKKNKKENINNFSHNFHEISSLRCHRLQIEYIITPRADDIQITRDVLSRGRGSIRRNICFHLTILTCDRLEGPRLASRDRRADLFLRDARPRPPKNRVRLKCSG